MDNEMKEPKVLSVTEGIARGDSRVFSVVMDGPCGEDLSVVAAARDPKSGDAIPAAGSQHPDDAELIARPPLIYPIGTRVKDGARLTARSNFCNVRVRYVKSAAADGEAG